VVRNFGAHIPFELSWPPEPCTRAGINQLIDPKVYQSIKCLLILIGAHQLNGMSSNAMHMGIWVAFLKQPDALPCRAPRREPQTINKNIFELLLINFLFFINDFYFLEFF
jgi:hypothetical protein